MVFGPWLERMQQSAAGYTTYVLSTFHADVAVEDGPNDLVKIGESVKPWNRVRTLRSASPLPVKLTTVLYPFRDHWAHEFCKADARWLEAGKLGLPAPGEWFRGGAEMDLVWWILHEPLLHWVTVKEDTQRWGWVDVRELLAQKIAE